MGQTHGISLILCRIENMDLCFNVTVSKSTRFHVAVMQDAYSWVLSGSSCLDLEARI